LIDHRVDRFLQQKDFAAHVDCNLLGQIPVRHRDGHVRNVANLRGEIARHRVDAFGEVLPNPRHLWNLRLAAELSLRADLARHARHLRGENAELLQHGVDDIRRLQELALERPAIHIETHRL
jgi:hypothetical protein